VLLSSTGMAEALVLAMVFGILRGCKGMFFLKNKIYWKTYMAFHDILIDFALFPIGSTAQCPTVWSVTTPTFPLT